MRTSSIILLSNKKDKEMEGISKLHLSLKQRHRPEDIAEQIQNVLCDELSTSEFNILEKASKGSLKRQLHQYTSMFQDFSKALGPENQIEKIIEIFNIRDVKPMNSNELADIKQFIAQISPLINKNVGDNNFVTDRLNKTQRKALGIEVSKRTYNKQWRLLKRLENKLATYKRELRKVEFQMIANHGLVHHLKFNAFSEDENTACFIAYYNARCSMRSVFTNQSQTRPFDEICEMLYNRCKRKDRFINRLWNRRKNAHVNSTNWLAIAHIYPQQEVLKQLTEKQKGLLLGKWTSILQDIAGLLSDLWDENSIDRETMIVKLGNDSSTWNNTAGAWNKARDNWINLIYALGMDYILDEICFGKVMRLMAADVVSWHYSSGGKLDINTAIWNRLPLPWKVFNGEEMCNKTLVIHICKLFGIDAEKSGWISPKIHKVTSFNPTPELVHGVAISSPFLAKILKNNNYYSGKYKS